MQQHKILFFPVIHYFHHATTQYPGHGTKFVMLPSPIYIKSSKIDQVLLCDQIIGMKW